MASPQPGHHKYNVTVAGLTATCEGPDDIVAMYLRMRRAYQAPLTLEVRSIDEDLRFHHAVVEKVNSYHGHH